MPRYLRLFVPFLLLILYACSATKPAIKPGQQLAQSFERITQQTVAADFLLYLPPQYEADDRHWPLLLFLHGAGERGKDLERVKWHGPPKLIAAGRDFPFIVVSPQCPEGERWSTDVLNGLLDQMEEQYRVDEKRIYVTGLSMGGYGTWALAQRYPERFAAIAPVCGGGNPAEACAIKDVPTWVFHGEKDTVVPFEYSQVMVDELKRCRGNPRFTAYPEAGHDAWSETYDNQALYDWFLLQQR